MEGTPV